MVLAPLKRKIEQTINKDIAAEMQDKQGDRVDPMRSVIADTIMTKDPLKREPSWTEEFSIGGRQLMALIERLLAKGNVRRLVVLTPNGRVLFETSLTTGVAVAGVCTILAPVLTALGSMAALLAEVRVKIIYSGKPRR